MIQLLPLLLFLSSSIYEPLHLDDKTFIQQLEKSPINFVMAFRSNVSFCQDALPKFRAVAEILKDKIQFVILEDENSDQVKKMFGIFSYPSFFVFRYANYSCEYKGERDSAHFLAYLKRILVEPVKQLDTARDVHDFLDAADSAVILAGQDIDVNLLNMFNSVASNLSDMIQFAIATDIDAIQQLELEELPSIRLHRSEDRQIVEYPMIFETTEHDLREWIIKNMVPRYSARNSVTFRDLTFDKRYTVLAFVDTSRKISLDSMHKTLDRLTTEFGTNFTYVYSDIFDVGNIILQLGFSGMIEPIYCIAMLANGEISEKFLFPEKKNATPDNVVKWVKKFMNQTNFQHMKSEDPVLNQTGPFYKLVGKDFMQVTSDPEKDVVTLLLNGDEEDRSRKMKIVETVAKEFRKQNVQNVTFHYIDLDLNVIPGLNKSDFQNTSILIFPAAQQKQTLLLPSVFDELTLMNAVLQFATTKPKFRIPGKYDSGSIEL